MYTLGKGKKPVRVERALIRSKAFLSLKGISSQVLMLFLCKRRMKSYKRKGREEWICENWSELSFTYIEAEKKHGITGPRFTRAIDDLIDKGFLDIWHQGGVYRHDKSIYALSDRWQKYGKPDFEKSERPKDLVQRGYRKPKRIDKRTKAAHKDVPLYTDENVVVLN